MCAVSARNAALCASFFVLLSRRICRGAVGYTKGDLSPKADGVILTYDFSNTPTTIFRWWFFNTKGEYMKNKKLFVICACLLVMPAFAAAKSGGGIDGMCVLIQKFQDIFKLLRTLAFVGAGMLVAKYAWEAISEGKIGGEADLTKAAKNVGIPMILGFVLLFGIGVLLHVLSSATGAEILGCPALFTNW